MVLRSNKIMCFFLNKTNEGGAVQRDYSEVNFTSVGLLFITLMELQVGTIQNLYSYYCNHEPHWASNLDLLSIAFILWK